MASSNARVSLPITVATQSLAPAFTAALLGPEFALGVGRAFVVGAPAPPVVAGDAFWDSLAVAEAPRDNGSDLHPVIARQSEGKKREAIRNVIAIG